MSEKRRIVLVAKLAISVFVLLCTIEALYWPLLIKPGTVLEWWQVEWLAKTGFLLGLPTLAAMAGIELLSPPDFLFPALPLGLALLWSTFFYWLLGVALRWRRKKPTNRPSQLRGADAPLRG